MVGVTGSIPVVPTSLRSLRGLRAAQPTRISTAERVRRSSREARAKRDCRSGWALRELRSRSINPRSDEDLMWASCLRHRLDSAAVSIFQVRSRAEPHALFALPWNRINQVAFSDIQAHLLRQVEPFTATCEGNATMPRVKRASKQTPTTKAAAVTALGAAGLGLSLAGGASASTVPIADVPQPDGISPNQRIVLSEEEMADVSLATFHLFDHENLRGDMQVAYIVRGCRCGGCRCGGCAWRGCRCGGCGGCGGCCLRWGRCRIC
jgi:hypothetical protein